LLYQHLGYQFVNKKHNKEEILKISSEKWNNEYTIVSESIEYSKKQL